MRVTAATIACFFTRPQDPSSMQLTKGFAPVLVVAWVVTALPVRATGRGTLIWLLAGALVGVAVGFSPLIDTLSGRHQSGYRNGNS